ncbi:hypothetical protein NQ315_002997 [Exocentrus adspersus]|uniref:Uncharacterized protein n=1 Tax=Exocentrus adspersus TaxID=1586481 RepID=A0AAV8W5I6_9CUCU|nr:hypothetical protein NQ315_002997 [Exocentrus adspersus]
MRWRYRKTREGLRQKTCRWDFVLVQFLKKKGPEHILGKYLKKGQNPKVFQGTTFSPTLVAATIYCSEQEFKSVSFNACGRHYMLVTQPSAAILPIQKRFDYWT